MKPLKQLKPSCLRPQEQFSKLSMLKYDAGWLKGLIWTGCEKTPVLSLQLWTLKASKMLGEGLVILWHWMHVNNYCQKPSSDISNGIDWLVNLSIKCCSVVTCSCYPMAACIIDIQGCVYFNLFLRCKSSQGENNITLHESNLTLGQHFHRCMLFNIQKDGLYKRFVNCTPNKFVLLMCHALKKLYM